MMPHTAEAFRRLVAAVRAWRARRLLNKALKLDGPGVMEAVYDGIQTACSSVGTTPEQWRAARRRVANR
jgi:hypothetical protein